MRWPTIRKTAKTLPREWDIAVTGHPFLTKNMLEIIEAVNPCGQRYYFLNGGNPDCAVSYTLQINLLSFTRLYFPYRVTIFGVPLSVSSTAIVSHKKRSPLFSFIASLKGMKIVLNSDSSFVSDQFISGQTLSTFVLENRWTSFNAYLTNMRSHYRYRIKKARQRWKVTEEQRLQNNESFNRDIYALYEAVYHRSQYKLEKLPIAYFKTFPGEIFTYTIDGILLAFVQLYQYNDSLLFLFGGLNYELNKRYDIYLNILLEIIQKGIERKCSSIHLGQTADEIKMKLGCKENAKYIHLHHSSRILHKIIKIVSPWVLYSSTTKEYRVFKEESSGTDCQSPETGYQSPVTKLKRR